MSSAEPLRLLVTGAGAPGIVGTLHALRHNPDGAEVFVLGVDLTAHAAGRALCDAFELVPKPSDAAYAETLLAHCRKHRIGLIVPQTTAETLYYAANRALFERAGVKVMVCGDTEAVTCANDKYLLAGLFEKLSLPYPRNELAKTTAAVAAAAKRLGYPERNVVVKLPNSNGSRGLRILSSVHADLDTFLNDKPNVGTVALEEFTAMLEGQTFPPLMVCEYLPGVEYSVDVFADGETVVSIPRVRLQIRSGISFWNRIELREDMQEASAKIAAALGLRGVFGFQFKLNDRGEPAILECNPRIQGTMVASMAAGVNVIWLGVCAALGRPYSIPASLRNGGEFRRLWGGVLVDGDDTRII
jgi:carbamoyl-phosphate synthase large subunit